jgi:transposase
MKEFIGKRYFQFHALVDKRGHAVARKLPRSQFLAFFRDVAPCLIGMEACGSAHYWARELRAMGHEVRLIPPIYVKPYVKRGKNDAGEARRSRGQPPAGVELNLFLVFRR